MSGSFSVDIEAGLVSEQRIQGATPGALAVAVMG